MNDKLYEGDKQEKHTKAHNVFFFNDTASTEIYTLSLHDALPIFLGAITRSEHSNCSFQVTSSRSGGVCWMESLLEEDRKSTRLNSSHGYISYAVFCLKKQTKTHKHTTDPQQS